MALGTMPRLGAWSRPCWRRALCCASTRSSRRRQKCRGSAFIRTLLTRSGSLLQLERSNAEMSHQGRTRAVVSLIDEVSRHLPFYAQPSALADILMNIDGNANWRVEARLMHKIILVGLRTIALLFALAPHARAPTRQSEGHMMSVHTRFASMSARSTTNRFALSGRPVKKEKMTPSSNLSCQPQWRSSERTAR
jgi:hypothetical protein